MPDEEGRTKDATPAFIKELRRRCGQFQIELSPGNVLTGLAVDAAFEEMLFTGGALNRFCSAAVVLS